MRFYIVWRSSIISDYRASSPGLAETKLDFPWIPRFSILGVRTHVATANPGAFRQPLAAFSRPGREQFFREKKQFPAVGWRSTKSTRRQFFRRFCGDGFFDDSSTLKSIFGDSAPHEDFSDQPARKFIKFYEVHVVGLFEKNVPWRLFDFRKLSK